MIINYRLILLALFSGIALLAASLKLSGQDPRIKSIGVPNIDSYMPSEYGFSYQNFDVLIGDDQKIYFANGQGVLVFDGNTWTQLELPNGLGTYSLTKASDGTIYVGGVNEIGFLKATSNGTLTYISLTPDLKKQYEDGFTSWNNFTAGNRIVFSTLSKLFIFNHQTRRMSVIDCPGAWPGMMVKDDIIYSYQGDSLYVLENNKWKVLRRSSLLAPTLDSRVVVLKINDSRTMAINNHGFFDFETEQPIEIHENTLTFLSTRVIIAAKLLFGKYIAITTWSGLLITDLKGNPIQFLDKEKGLSADFLFHLELDKYGGIWLASLNGIHRLDIASPYTVIQGKNSINELVTSVELLGDDLYISTYSGILKTNWESFSDPFSSSKYEKISPLLTHGFLKSQSELITLMEWPNNLQLAENDVKQIERTFGKLYIYGFVYPGDSDIILGSENGHLMHLRKENGDWGSVKELKLDLDRILYLEAGDGNTIWVGSDGKGVKKLEYDRDQMELISQENQTNGLPDELNISILSVDDEPLFLTKLGVYKFDHSSNHFSIDERFSKGNKIKAMVNDSKQNIYYISKQFNILKKNLAGYDRASFPNINLLKYPINNLTALDENNILISSNNAIVHIDPTILPPTTDFEVKFTGVSSLETDSIYFGGFGSIPSTLLFEPNASIRLTFTSTFYQNPSSVQYRWRLNGEKWSQWSHEVRKDYTNLTQGAYTFEVIGKNAFGTESPITFIEFSIQTPWFFTIWAHLGYIVAFYLLIWVIIKMYTRKIRADRDRLEKVVEERTVEINEQKNKLLKMDDLKKRFFVNISHELRTPLTLSMGTVDQALKGTYGHLNDELYANLQVSKRNSERLLKMVTSILDISKLEGGRIQLYATSIDPSDIVTKVLAFFSSRLEDKRISLKENLIHGTELYIDQDKFETILINLLSNAFKFTPDGGVISFSMKNLEEEMIFEIKDSGSGIPESDLNLVFDRFYQSPTVKSGEGMGVGLALTKELVELHHGTVGAKNDGGAVFTLTFPKGKDHFTPNQIVDYQESTTSINLADKYPLHDDRSITLIPEKEHDSHAEHILLVEDNIEMRQFISGILSPYYQVSWAEDGSKGLEFLKETKPDLIITDYLMPNMDGYEMATEIKKSDELAFIPIVFLTARAREQDKINVLNLGVDDYLYKPFSTDELLVRVKNLLFNKKHRAEYIEEQEIDSSEIAWKEFDSKLKQDIDSYIQENIKSEITSDDLAKIAGHSERSLYRKVKANTGLTLMLYVKEYRLRQARSLLENKELSTVSEVSYAVGFNYLSHFTKNYKERFGKNPSEYLE